MVNRKVSAGDIIEARCTRCRDYMNHTIVAMVGDRVVRVECNTCRGTHNYHGRPEPKQPAASAASGTSQRKAPAAPRVPRKDPGQEDREEWLSLRASLEREIATTYNMAASYRVKSVISHPTFGLGIVKTVLPNKVEVLFESGKKLLRSA